MMAGVDRPRPTTFMPIQMSGFSAVTAIVAGTETQLDSMVADIKSNVAARVRELAQKSSKALFGKLIDTVKDLEEATDAAYEVVESAEKKTDELIANAGEATPAASVDSSTPAVETPTEDDSCRGHRSQSGRNGILSGRRGSQAQESSQKEEG